jgi:hypothetical protein
MTPEVRLSPDGSMVAIRNRDSRNWPWNLFHALQGDHAAMDDDVSDWTPLLPASSEDGAA